MVMKADDANLPSLRTFRSAQKKLRLSHRVPKINFRVILLFNFHGLAHNFSNSIENSGFFFQNPRSPFTVTWLLPLLKNVKDERLILSTGTHQRCSIKNLFLKILQYSQENTCVGVSF